MTEPETSNISQIIKHLNEFRNKREMVSDIAGIGIFFSDLSLP